MAQWSVPPAVHIELPLEGAPRVRIVCMNEGEENRLWHWVFTHDELADLLARALELAEDQQAA